MLFRCRGHQRFKWKVFLIGIVSGFLVILIGEGLVLNLSRLCQFVLNLLVNPSSICKLFVYMGMFSEEKLVVLLGDLS